MANLRATVRLFREVSWKRFVTNVSQKRSKTTGHKLEFQQFGNPLKVLDAKSFEVFDDVSSDEILLQLLAAPVNPADIYTIEGIYGVKPRLPAVPGVEGVAKVLKVGSNVKHVKENDVVIPVTHNWGTWITHQVAKATDVEKVPLGIPWEVAATVLINPITAYHMLTDFVSLNRGDVVIQNGGNSSVGQAVIQIARHKGIKTVSVVRVHPELGSRKEALMELGADYVLTDEELRTSVANELFQKIPRPKLALNCVGGRSAADIARWLADRGVVVTYGGISGQPQTLSVGLLIFKDVSFRGFWCGKFLHTDENKSKFKQTLTDIFEMIQAGKFKSSPYQLTPFLEYKSAIDLALKSFVGRKQILVMK